ncbi:Wzz/FepE/Etk N-terminal domain-containing protein [Mesorhizobium sp.]|uniref:Wzz/FepE/Etk N-terminal domain-containing protein n=1 Tax=Mesorhizobium sp. TaxID=1871066 RepID=UPI000FE75230|nr:Wzz/FepE/Etk N-terminal domain-containing protein [Mesorhizobium sp.]RWQ61604.1 MAG: hypothetical protein EOS83_00610 [Mesorhizobium sp.]
MDRIDKSSIVAQSTREEEREVALAHVPPVDLLRPLRILYAQKWLVLAILLVISVCGVFYVLQQRPIYTARGLLLIENTRLETGREELLPIVSNVDVSAVDTQVEIIRSDSIALHVIASLDLVRDLDFVGSGAKSLARRTLDTFSEYVAQVPALRDIAEWLGSGSLQGQQRSERVALQAFQNMLSVKRVGMSSVIEVSFRSHDADKSARIVNEILNAYLAQQLDAAAAATANASAWLRDRVKDLGTKARVISLAGPPVRREGPTRTLLLAGFVALGLLLGIGAAALRFALDQTIRNPQQIERLLNVPYLGAVMRRTPYRAWPERRTSRRLMRAPLSPSSDLAFVVKRIRTAALRRGRGQIIGLTSIISGEGATTLASNLACSAVVAGCRVLLIDGNPYKPSLTRLFEPGATTGLLDVLAGRCTIAEAVAINMKSGVHFLPYAGGVGTPVVDAVRVQSFVRECRDSYDIVVVDLPPFAPVPELLCARTFVDAFVLVVEWARIPSSLLTSAVLAAGMNQNDFLGFVLNKVNRIAIDPFSYPIESHLSKYRFQEYAEWPAAQSFPSIVPWRIERSLARGDVHYTGTLANTERRP